MLVNTVSAQEKIDLYGLLESAQKVLDTTVSNMGDGEYELPYELVSRAEFSGLSKDLNTALNEGNLETMAKWLPDTNKLMSILDATPGLEPYADWLRQRLDYMQVANDAVNVQPLANPVSSGEVSKNVSPKVNRKGSSGANKSSPIPKAKPKVVTEKSGNANSLGQSKSRSAFARDAKTWSKKLANRKTAAGAAGLVPPLKKIFSAQGVPPELVWIAEVESTFNPAARSPAGAVGLFQLMPATAKHLGLKLKPEDQRLDPMNNGRASAKYLKALHDRFEDWPLAIAAYNGGEGRISKLLKANNAKNLEDISDQLPGQTQMYVPKVLATIRLREGFDPSSRW